MFDDQNYRIAALKLHALHPDDRKWILSHFESAQQEKLRVLIEELEELDLAPIKTLQESDISYPIGNFQLAPSLVAEINQMGSEKIMRHLNSLPEILKAMVLHAWRWRWSSAVWLMFDLQQRQRLLRYAHQFDSVKPSVFTALVESFADEIKKSADSGLANQQASQRIGQTQFWMA
jgi:hypothetical protein